MPCGNINVLYPPLSGKISTIPTLVGVVSSPQTIIKEMEYKEVSNVVGGLTAYIGQERRN